MEQIVFISLLSTSLICILLPLCWLWDKRRSQRMFRKGVKSQQEFYEDIIKGYEALCIECKEELLTMENDLTEQCRDAYLKGWERAGGSLESYYDHRLEEESALLAIQMTGADERLLDQLLRQQRALPEHIMQRIERVVKDRVPLQ